MSDAKKSQVVVITGGGGNIGRSLAQRYIAEGDQVHLLDRLESIDELAESMGAIGHCVDGGNADEITQLLSKFERIDILITAVGSWPLINVDDLTPTLWCEQINLNLNTTYFAIYAALPALRNASGSVVCITSAIAIKGHPQMIQYAAAKAGVTGMVRALALALGPDGIRINSVAPGLVMTDAQAQLWGAERVAQFRGARALDRDIFVDDVVEAVCYFASAASASVTGQSLVVDGGTVLQ